MGRSPLRALSARRAGGSGSARRRRASPRRRAPRRPGTACRLRRTVRKDSSTPFARPSRPRATRSSSEPATVRCWRSRPAGRSSARDLSVRAARGRRPGLRQGRAVGSSRASRPLGARPREPRGRSRRRQAEEDDRSRPGRRAAPAPRPGRADARRGARSGRVPRVRRRRAPRPGIRGGRSPCVRRGDRPGQPGRLLRAAANGGDLAAAERRKHSRQDRADRRRARGEGRCAACRAPLARDRPDAVPGHARPRSAC